MAKVNELLVDELQGKTLGTADDGPLLTSIFTLASRKFGSKLTYPNKFEIEFPVQLAIETTPKIQDCLNLKLSGAGWIARNLGVGDNGNLDNVIALDAAKDTTYRNRPLLYVVRGDGNKIAPGFKMVGPHSTKQRRQFYYCVEGQHGVWIKATKRFEMYGTLDGVWSDHVYAESDTVYGNFSDDVKLLYGTYGLNGRHIFGVHCVDNLDAGWNTITGARGALYHVETGRGKYKVQHNHKLRFNTLVNCNRGYAHVTGGYGLDGCYVEYNVVDGDCLELWFDADPRLEDGSARIKNLFINENMWDRSPEGYFWIFRNIDGIYARGNDGPVRKIRTVSQSIETTDCRNVSIPLDQNHIWRPAA